MDYFIKADCLRLSQTLFCGQCFRFKEIGEGLFHGVAGNRAVTLRQENDSLKAKQEGMQVDGKTALQWKEDYENAVTEHKKASIIIVEHYGHGILMSFYAFNSLSHRRYSLWMF